MYTGSFAIESQRCAPEELLVRRFCRLTVLFHGNRIFIIQYRLKNLERLDW